MPGARHRWRQPAGQGTDPNPRNQLIRSPLKKGWPKDYPCLACKRQVRLRLGLGFLGLTQPLVQGTDGYCPSGWDLGQIQEANLSDADKVGPVY